MAETTHLNSLKINVLTWAQFEATTKDPNQLYVITDAEEVIVDTALSATSTNAIQNKTVKLALDDKAPLEHIHTLDDVSETTAKKIMTADERTKLSGIATGANKYVHPTTSGNKHIPAGGASGQILRWSADGTAVWGADNNTTYGAAGTALGLVKSGGDVTISSGVINVNDDSHNHVIANIDGLQTILDNLQNAIENLNLGFVATEADM